MKVEPIVLEGRVVRLEPLEVRHAADFASAATRKLFDDHFPPAELTEAGIRAQTPGRSAMSGWCVFAIEFVSIELISNYAVLNACRASGWRKPSVELSNTRCGKADIQNTVTTADTMTAAQRLRTMKSSPC
jgi:hypothetical protein